MKISELNRLNKDKDFVHFREGKLDLLLYFLALGGSGVLLLLFVADQYLYSPLLRPVSIRYLIYISVFTNLFLLAFNKIYPSFVKTFIIVGFYSASIFAGLLSFFTNYNPGIFWIILEVSLIAWLTLMPFSYRILIFHGFVFILLFNLVFGSLGLRKPDTNWAFLTEINLVFVFTYLLGIYIGISQNLFKAFAFISRQNLELAGNTLAQSEEKYRMLVDKATDGIIITQNGKFRFVNKAFCRMTGFAEEELIGMPFVDITHPDDRERLMEYHRRRMRGDDFLLVYTARGLMKNGRALFMELNSTTIDFEGHPAAFIIIRDITERHEMQEALEASERKYREFTDFLPQVVYELDEKGILTYVNKVSYEVFGMDEKDTFIGKSGLDFYIPADRERMMNNILSEQTAKGRIYNEYTALKKDGTIFPVMIYSSPVFKGEKVVGRRGIIVDISERKKMEQALKDSEEKYRLLIQSLQEGLFVIQNGEFVFLNQNIVKIVGYSVDELLGKPLYEIIAPELREEVMAMHVRRLKGEPVPSEYETCLFHKDQKTKVPVIISVSISNYMGKPAVIGTAKDITERKRYEEQLKDAKNKLQNLNVDLERRIADSTEKLTHANTMLLQLQKENLQSQFDMLKNQVNPHFLFNSLNVLTSLIKIEPELAEKFTEQLSKVYRYVLENKDKNLVSLATELEFLSSYVFLLNIRFKDKLFVSISVPEENTQFLVLPLALQLLIENSIKHNTFSKKSPLNIEIFTDANMNLHVVNNLQVRDSNFASTGVGLKNIHNRYSLLTDKQPQFEKTNTHFIARIPLLEPNTI